MLRRQVLSTALGFGALSSLAWAAQPASGAGDLVYIGTHTGGRGQGLFAARFDPQSGALTAMGLAAEIERPTWLAVHPELPVLYSVVEVGNDRLSEASVVALTIDPATGTLKKLNQLGTGGGGATHLDMDPKSKTLFVANFGGGLVSAMPLGPEGALELVASAQSDFGSGPHVRQKFPHAHGVTLDRSGQWLLSADLGADRVFHYRWDAATRTLSRGATAFTQFPPGTGPRHLLFSADGRFAYVTTELAAEIRVFGWNATAGRLTPVQTVPIDPPDFKGAKSAAETAISRDGRFFYVSNRGADTLIVYAVDKASGRLSEVQRLPCGGKSPWSFTLHSSGRWMIVANEASNALAVFAVDPATGKLTATSNSLSVPTPVVIAFYPAR